MKRILTLRYAAAVTLAAALSITAAASAPAAVRYFPGVTEVMTNADYWVWGDADADRVLLDGAGIARLNQKMLADPACCMFDLENYVLKEGASAVPANRRMAEKAYEEIIKYAEKGGYFRRSGETVDAGFAEEIRDILLRADPAAFRTLRYGIAVRRTDLRAWPTEEIVTDEKGDTDFDYVQLSGAAVNDPVVIAGETADRQWYYCCTDNCSGWIRASDLAVCKNKQEWLSAWKIPASNVLVVTESRFALEYSNTHPELSGLVLTMGTVLERADGAGPTGTVAAGAGSGAPGDRIGNRASFQNYVVWIPVRNADGSYQKVKALISERHKVSEGYLPMTRRNILRTALNALGDAYGWGGMLSAEDCSGFLHGLYACFGMRLPRNTTWQAASPLFRYDLNYLPDAEKAEVIGGLPAGAMLYFNGHTMLYLGEKDGKAYVLSSVSSMMDPFGTDRIRVRSVVINNLDTRRANGNSWLTSLHTAVVPYFDPGEPGNGFRSFPDGIRYRRDNGSFAALNWQEVGNDWYYFDRDGLMAVDRWIPARDEADTWYYAGADGRMARDTVIGGYPVDPDGAWRKE